jgi:hypothetical protein
MFLVLPFQPRNVGSSKEIVRAGTQKTRAILGTRLLTAFGLFLDPVQAHA